MKVLLVGYGRMGRAMVARWGQMDLTVVSPHCPDQKQFYTDVELLDAATYQPDVIVFSVKPQKLPDIAPAYSRFIKEQTLVISVAAGFSLESLGRYVAGIHVRAMPNLPVVVGQGITGLYGQDIDEATKHKAELLFASLGRVLWVPSEIAIDAVTAISGSGPAYFYYFTECLVNAAESQGFDRESALMLAQQTFLGAAQILLNITDRDVISWKQEVTSPNGTTAAALAAFEQGNLQDSVDSAVNAAFLRARELSN